MALKVDIGANTREAQREVKDLSKALDANADALDDLARDSSKAGDKVEKSFRDMVREAKKAERALDDVGESGPRSFKNVGAAAGELQQEIGQNLGETVSSFRGDLSDLGQIGQDTLGGLAATVAGLGPAGALGAGALAGLALGWGAISSAIEGADEKQAEFNASAAKWADAYEGAASRIVDSAHIVAEVNRIATDPDAYDEATRNAKAWGIDVSEAMLAMAGDADSLALAQESLTERTRAYDDALDGTLGNVQAGAEAHVRMTEALGASRGELAAGQEALDLQNAAMAEGATRADNTAAAYYTLAERLGVATGATDDLGNAIVRLPDGKEVVIDAQTGRAFTDLDALERKAIPDKTATAKADTSAADKKLRELEEMRLNDKVIKVRTSSIDDSTVYNYRPPTVYLQTKLLPPTNGRDL